MCRLGCTGVTAICWMIYAIHDGNIFQEVRIDVFQAADVVPVLVRERPPLVMRVDAAVGAEVVLGDFGVELVELEMLLALQHGDSI